MLYEYVIVDVFSSTPFGGNQLAVLTNASGISDVGMQLIAREFNFAETTFVLAPNEPGCSRRVRIFTPGRELPFAGHPTLGTACVLVKKRHCPAGLVRLEEGIGPIDVAVVGEGGRFAGTLKVEQAPTIPNLVPQPAHVAAALSLPADEVERVFCAGLGVDFTFVQLSSEEAVDRAILHQASWQQYLAATIGAQLFFYSGQLANGSELYGRMFAPGFGIPEDPATGSAVGALVGAAPSVLGDTQSDVFSLRVTQGVRMGRPSLLQGVAHCSNGQVQAIEVSGAVAFTAEGEIDVPEEFATGS